MYRRLTGILGRESTAFMMWFSVEHPDYLAPEIQVIITGWLNAGRLQKEIFSKASCLEFIHRPDLYRMKADWLEDNE